MKKTLVLISIISVLFTNISCSNMTDNNDINGITVKELINKIPATLEDLEKNDSSRMPEREDVDLSKEPSIITHGYNNITFINYSAHNLLLAILKNDVSSLPDFSFNTKTTIGKIELSQKTIDFAASMGMTTEGLNDLGIIEVIYNEPKVEIFWQIDATNGDGIKSKMFIYITGLYKNGEYENTTAFFNFNFGTNAYEIEQLCKTESNFVKQHIFKGEDGRATRDIVEKSPELTKLYRLGSSDMPKNPTPEELAEASKYKELIHIDETGACEFKNFRFNSKERNYWFYDKDGSLILEERKTNYTNGKYTQTIPLKYISASLEKDGSGNYYKKSGEKVEEIMQSSFKIERNEHKDYYCYVTESDSENVIAVKEDITFTKNDYIQDKLSKLNEMESKVEATASRYLSEAEIKTMSEKLAEWIETL